MGACVCLGGRTRNEGMEEHAVGWLRVFQLCVNENYGKFQVNGNRYFEIDYSLSFEAPTPWPLIHFPLASFATI